jgi:hypothetical protein
MQNIEKSFGQNSQRSIFPLGLQYGLMVVDKLLSLELPKSLFISSEGFCSDRTGNGNSAGILIKNDHTFRSVRVTANLSCGDIRVYYGDINTIEQPLCSPSETLECEDWEEKDITKLASDILKYLSVEDYSAVDAFKQKVANRAKLREE